MVTIKTFLVKKIVKKIGIALFACAVASTLSWALEAALLHPDNNMHESPKAGQTIAKQYSMLSEKLKRVAQKIVTQERNGQESNLEALMFQISTAQEAFFLVGRTYPKAFAAFLETLKSENRDVAQRFNPTTISTFSESPDETLNNKRFFIALLLNQVTAPFTLTPYTQAIRAAYNNDFSLLDQNNDESQNILVQTIINGHIKIFISLCTRLAPHRKYTQMLLSQKDENHYSSLDYAMEIKHQEHQNQCALIILQTAENPYVLIKQKDYNLLMLCCEKNNTVVAEAICELYKKKSLEALIMLITQCNNEQENSFMIAAEHNALAILKLFFNYFLHDEWILQRLILTQNKSKQNPLLLAVLFDHKELAHYLLDTLLEHQPHLVKKLIEQDKFAVIQLTVKKKKKDLAIKIARTYDAAVLCLKSSPPAA